MPGGVFEQRGGTANESKAGIITAKVQNARFMVDEQGAVEAKRRVM